MTDENTLKINVHEDVKALAVGIGNQAPPEIDKAQLVEDGKKVLSDEVARYYEESMKYLQRYVPPHKVKSRWVVATDLDRVLSEGQVMLQLCTIPHGMYGNANAIAHPQIEDKDPLRFFVTNNGLVIINPVCTSHTKYPVFKNQGCMSHPSEPIKTMVKSFNKITVKYQMLIKDDTEKPRISPPQEVTYNGNLAEVFVHELCHLNSTTIYDDFYVPESCEGLGNGLLTEEELDKLYDNVTQEQSEVSKKDADEIRVDDKGGQIVSV